MFNKDIERIKEILVKKAITEIRDFFQFDYEPIVLYFTIIYFDKYINHCRILENEQKREIKPTNNLNITMIFFSIFWILDKFIDDKPFYFEDINRFIHMFDYYDTTNEDVFKSANTKEIFKYEIEFLKFINWKLELNTTENINSFEDVCKILKIEYE